MGMFCLHDTRMREWNERTDAASAIGSLSEYFCFVWPHQKIKKKKVAEPNHPEGVQIGSEIY